MDWQARRARAAREHEERAARAPAADEREDIRLARIAGASWSEGLAALMLGDGPAAVLLLRRAAGEYRESWGAAPAASWGRPIAAMRCRILAEDGTGLCEDASNVLAEGSAESDGPIAAYATVLALLALRRDAEAGEVARTLQGSDDFVAPVADALAALAAHEPAGYGRAADAVLASFEARDAFLEDTPVADTVLVLDALAAARGIVVTPRRSTLLPAPA